MTMKRLYNTADDVERFAMANCAMILHSAESRSSNEQCQAQMFKCKTCQRSFTSFQALGGHMASHRRPKLLESRDTGTERKLLRPHRCSVCSAEFWTGQALGGHMRKHRVVAPKIHDFLGTSESNNSNHNNNNNNNSSTITSSNDDCSEQDLKMGNVSSNCYGKRRILGLDLNLSPEQNELKIFEF